MFRERGQHLANPSTEGGRALADNPSRLLASRVHGLRVTPKRSHPGTHQRRGFCLLLTPL